MPTAYIYVFLVCNNVYAVSLSFYDDDDKTENINYHIKHNLYFK